MIVVSDTSPLHYLILIEHDELMPRLMGTVIAPSAVLEELRGRAASANVRRWADHPPAWLQIVDPAALDTELLLDKGEAAAISLALELRSRGEQVRVLIDEREGREVALARGLRVTGTLGVLIEGAAAGLVDMHDAIARLRATNFHATPELLDEALRLGIARKGGS